MSGFTESVAADAALARLDALLHRPEIAPDEPGADDAKYSDVLPQRQLPQPGGSHNDCMENFR